MKVNLVSIGNSKGVRIPASVIKECGLGNQLEMRVQDDVVVLAPARDVREGLGCGLREDGCRRR